MDCINPSTGEVLAQVQLGTGKDMLRCIENANIAKVAWANTPAPKVIVSFLYILLER